METPSIKSDLPQRVINAILEPSLDGPLGWCHNCNSEIRFKIEKYLNEIIDEVAHEIKKIESGGEIEPRICLQCGVVNIYQGEDAICAAPRGFEFRRVVSVAGEDVPIIESPMGNDVVDFNALIQLVDPLLDIKYKQLIRNRPALSRVEWVDYFGSDPAIILSRDRASCQRAGLYVLG
jgi:hypothetical protein